ncbi:MAG: Choline-sulfatase [Firmicutes bacterium ADurb.Bin193]|nr:MAG: Choline-sulfatase [Firmicutes bacterium ADurb.Bin193]
MKKRPHIIIFNPDQFRGDALGHLGNEAAVTPNFDKIIENDAVSFRNAFCQNPVCTPSRCSFMSGWYPHVKGHRIMHYMMHEDEPVLIKTLKNEGYYVWWGGKNDLTPGQESVEPYCTYKNRPGQKRKLAPNLHAIQDWRGPKDGDNYYSFYAGKLDTKGEDVYFDGDWANVVDAIEFIKNAPKDQPICIFLSIGSPHPPYGVEDPWYSMIDRGKIKDRYPIGNEADKPSILKGIREGQRLNGWTEERWRELRATYLGMCSRVDHLFGMLMDALKEAGMYDDSAVFVFSDHGDFTGDYGLVEKTQNTFEDVLTNVPFIIKPPKWIDLKPGIRDALVELIDFPATVEAMTGIIPKHTHFGKSLLPVLAGTQDSHRDAVFCEGGRLLHENHCKERESLMKHKEPELSLYWPRQKMQTGDGIEHGKAVMVRTHEYKYVRRLYEKDELYDLKNDPMEVHNRIDDDSLADVLAALKDRLAGFYLETCDVVPYNIDQR